MALMRVRISLSGALITGPAVMTLFFEEAGGTAQDAVTACGTFLNAMDSVIQESVLWASESDVARIDGTNGAVLGVVTTTPVTGAGGTSQAQTPQETQGLIQWRTGDYTFGRELRGRTNIPGVPSSQVANGRPTSGYRSNLDAAAEALIANANCQLVVWSRTHGNWSDVVSATADDKFAVLRSRRD